MAMAASYSANSNSRPAHVFAGSRPGPVARRNRRKAADRLNICAYVGADPIGHTDPSGMIRQFVGEAGDDMSRLIDLTPQGSGWSSPRSYDWMGPMATSADGRLDSIGISRGSILPAGAYWGCVRYCNTSAGNVVDGAIVVQPSAVYDWVSSPTTWDRLRFAQNSVTVRLPPPDPNARPLTDGEAERIRDERNTPTPNPLSPCSYFSSSTYNWFAVTEAGIATILPEPFSRVVATVAAKDAFMAQVCSQ